MLQKLVVIIGTLTFSFLLFACDMVQPQASRPSVIISAPPSGSVYSVGEQVVVQSTASDPAKILRVELIVDGVTVRQDASPVATGQEQFSLLQAWNADRVGQRNLIVRATNAQGVTSESGINVTVQASAAAPTTAPTNAPTNAPTPIPPTDIPTQTALPSLTTNPVVTVIVTATGAPTQTATQTRTPTQTASQTATSASEAAVCTDNAAFVADVTIPDGTNFSPNVAFTKTWRVRNTGTCNWQNYALVFASGAQLNGAASVPVPTTAAGVTADISVPLTAPASFGNYKGTWRLRNANGTFFGTSVTVLINVPNPNTANATATNTTIPPTLPAAASCSGQPANFTFTASPTTINAGQAVTLNWDAVSNASVAVLNGGQFNQQGVGAPGSITASPTTTTTYTLTATCNNGGGTRTNSVTVTINAPAAPPAACSGTPTIDSFTISYATIPPGASVLLSWQTTNANQVNLTGGNLSTGVLAASGSIFDQPSVTTIYRLSALCTANNNVAAAQHTVNVVPCPSPVIGSFTASAETITAGQSVTLSWDGIAEGNFVQLTAGDSPAAQVERSGSRTFSPTTTTTYLLRAGNACPGVGISDQKSVTVTVLPVGGGACSGKPQIGSFTASATTINKGQIVTLFWDNITNADEVRLYSGGTEYESVGLTAQRNRVPNQTTTYELTALCSVSGTGTTQQMTITVNP